MIRLENVIKIYGEDYEKKIALNNICLEIKDGEFVAVTGPSGSGKSTLLNIIGCMDIPTKGRYYLDDTDITLKTKSQIEDIRKEKIGFVFQHFALMDYYTAYENIELPLIIKNIKRSERKRLVNEQLKLLGIEEVRTIFPRKCLEVKGRELRLPERWCRVVIFFLPMSRQVRWIRQQEEK